MPGEYQLPAPENERIFREKIVPRLLSSAQPQQRPLVVFIGGQTGAGKTAVADMITHAMGRRGGYINANMDFYTPHHPDYAALLAADETTASAHVRADTEQWWVKAQRHAISQRYDVVIESALRSRAEFEDLIPAFRDGGYTVEVALMAVPEALSRLGILDRYWRDVIDLGEGRFVDPAIHDECYQGVLRAAAAVEHDDLGDTVFAFRRSGQAVYANSRDASGTWVSPPGCVAAVQAERTRLWTAQEQAWFHKKITTLWRGIDPVWHPELQRIRALAQPLTGPSLPSLTAGSWRVTPTRAEPGSTMPPPALPHTHQPKR